MKKTAWLVLLFIILIVGAGYSVKANAADGVRVGLGKSIINSDSKIGEFGYEYNGFEVQASLMEAGETKRGDQEQVALYSLSYLIVPQWGYKGVEPYFKLGASYNDNSPLVGNTNFRLGVGIDFHDVWRLEYSHHSSAGIHQVNTGIDYVTITYKMPKILR
jgi:hypothetical protein